VDVWAVEVEPENVSNILIVSARSVKSVGTYSVQFGSRRKVAVASWLSKADAVAFLPLQEHVPIVIHQMTDGESGELNENAKHCLWEISDTHFDAG
jgi:hypothetical protein